MEGKIIARPTFSRKSGKWNIAVKTDRGEIKLGDKIDDLFFKYVEFDSKKDATKYIEEDSRLTLMGGIGL